MNANDMKHKIELYNEFLQDWPLDKVENMSLNQYTNLSKDSFTYCLETGMRSLGSIKGVSSFIFGIYKREDTESKESKRQYFYDKNNEYAWYKRFGLDKESVFKEVHKNVIEVIKAAQKNDILAIDNIDLTDIFKWKIAFHYQNKDDISIIPVFTKEALQLFLKSIDKFQPKMTIGEMHLAIKNHEKISSLDDAIQLAVRIWDEFQNFSTSIEKEYIKNNDELSESQRTNATSRLDSIEYEIKAHKISRKNPHNHLERSFRGFLEKEMQIAANDILQDESYIDFQFNYNNQNYICELKPTESQKEISYAVQNAVGQILRYSYKRKYDFKIIVFQGRPTEENLEFLEYLKDEHNIYYLYEYKTGKFKGNILNI